MADDLGFADTGYAGSPLMRTPCLDSLARHGFERVTLGERTLRTDVAVVSLLAIANEHLEPS